MIRRAHWYECRVADTKVIKELGGEKESRGLNSWQFYSGGPLAELWGHRQEHMVTVFLELTISAHRTGVFLPGPRST